MNHDFGEKKYEDNMEVWQTPKYIESRAKAIELIESDQYKGVIKDGDFWILKNKTKSGKIAYTGLIISHNACLKINDILPAEKKFKTDSFSFTTETFKNGLIGVYKDEDIFEIGEVSVSNCKNEYPYAMVLKRCFDRVVLKKSGIAQWGIYSDSEADEFKEPVEPKNEKNIETLIKEFRTLYNETEEAKVLEMYMKNSIEELDAEIIERYIDHKKYGKK